MRRNARRQHERNRRPQGGEDREEERALAARGARIRLTGAPPGPRRDLVTAAGLFAGAFAALALGMDRTINMYDEGLILTGAMRVAAGDVPHADFYANYGPWQFYFLAALFKIFGAHALVERVYDTALRAAIVALAYLLAVRTGNRGIAAVAALGTLLWVYAVGFYGYPAFPVLAFSLGAAWLLQPVLCGVDSRARLAAAGALVGLAALVRYDMGFYVFLALVLAIALAVLACTTAPRRGQVLGKQWPFVAGTSAVFLPVALAYATSAPIAAFAHDIIEYPVRYYAAMRSLPSPGVREIMVAPNVLAVYLPVLAGLAGLASLVSTRRDAGERGLDPTDALIATFTLLTFALYLKGLVRPSTIHFLPAIVSALLLAGALAARHVAAVAAVRASSLILLAALTLCAAEAAQGIARDRAAARTSVAARIAAVLANPSMPWCRSPAELASIQCLLLDPNREEVGVLLARATQPGERVFIGLTRHDKVFVNDAALYFAIQRLPATRWHHMDPGLQTRADVQAQMVEELRAARVRYVVLESSWDTFVEPNASANSSGVVVLDRYLRDNFRLAHTAGDVFLLERR